MNYYHDHPEAVDGRKAIEMTCGKCGSPWSTKTADGTICLNLNCGESTASALTAPPPGDARDVAEALVDALPKHRAVRPLEWVVHIDAITAAILAHAPRDAAMTPPDLASLAKAWVDAAGDAGAARWTKPMGDARPDYIALRAAAEAAFMQALAANAAEIARLREALAAQPGFVSVPVDEGLEADIAAWTVIAEMMRDSPEAFSPYAASGFANTFLGLVRRLTAARPAAAKEP